MILFTTAPLLAFVHQSPAGSAGHVCPSVATVQQFVYLSVSVLFPSYLSSVLYQAKLAITLHERDHTNMKNASLYGTSPMSALKQLVSDL